jgi:predicted transposase YbfD/YdcC
MVLTLDALHTTKKTARLITDELHAHYVLILMGNQPLARAAAQALPAGPDADWVQTTHVDEDRGHGRTERRTIRTAPADDTIFPGAAHAFRLRRDSGDLDGAWTGKEIVFGVHQPAHRARRPRAPQPLREGALVGFVRDTAFREDASKIRTGHGPENMASLRSFAINQLRAAGHTNIAAGLREMSLRPFERPLTLLGLS